MNIIVLSLISTIVFGIVDALFFILFAETLQTRLYKLKLFDMTMAELLTTALSTTVAMIVASIVHVSLEEQVYLIKHPLLDVSGIITGTLIVLFIYLFYIRTLRCMLFKTFCKK